MISILASAAHEVSPPALLHLHPLTLLDRGGDNGAFEDDEDLFGGVMGSAVVHAYETHLVHVVAAPCPDMQNAAVTSPTLVCVQSVPLQLQSPACPLHPVGAGLGDVDGAEL